MQFDPFPVTLPKIDDKILATPLLPLGSMRSLPVTRLMISGKYDDLGSCLSVPRRRCHSRGLACDLA